MVRANLFVKYLFARYDEMLVSLLLMLSGMFFFWNVFLVMLGSGCSVGGSTLVCYWSSWMACSLRL